MDKLAAIIPFLALAAPALVNAATCVQFDTQWNLYAFGGSEDVGLGQSSSWGCKFSNIQTAVLGDRDSA